MLQSMEPQLGNVQVVHILPKNKNGKEFKKKEDKIMRGMTCTERVKIAETYYLKK